MLLICSVMMSLNAFSQSATDSTKIQLTKPIAKLVIKDLIQFDGLSNEMQVMQNILTETNDKLLVQNQLVTNLQLQVNNYQKIINEQEQQFKIQEQISSQLEIDLKKQKIKTKITSGAGILLAIGAVVLIN